jgi:hypothetical protein
VTPPRPRSTLRRLGVIGFLVLLLGAVLPAAPVTAASDYLPDLRMAPIRDLRISRTASGRKLLRFTTEILNYGAGPFEVRGTRRSTGSAFDIDQIVHRSDGTRRSIQTTASVRYAGDGHDHYHIRRLAMYHLWSTRGTLRDSKIGFCFFDTNARYLSLPRAPRTRQYFESGCGTRGSLHTRSGISVGWGDRYPWNFAYQWIDITGLPSGTYTLRAMVDLYGQFTESRETNNCSYARISIGSSTVRVLASSRSCVNDWSTTPYADDVRWGLAAGMTVGCDPTLFCTYNATLRDELAVFISRLLRLPTTSQNVYSDDNGTRFEPWINRVGVAGVMPGCGAGKFCPSSKVSRQATAITLARALQLPPSENDHFTDDEGSSAEASINSVVDAGLMAGCADGRFCPTGTVTRGQMARILHLGFGSS